MSGPIELVDSEGRSIGGLRGTADGAAVVSDAANPSGLCITHFINVEPATAPIENTSGMIAWDYPVCNPIITSVYLTAGDVIALAATNWTIRVAIDPPNDAAALLALPTTFPTGSSDAVVGQVWSFNLKPFMITDYNDVGVADQRVFQIILDNPIEIPVVGDGIRKLAFAHNLAAGMTLVFGVQATRIL